MRSAALADDEGWGAKLDVEKFNDRGEAITFALKKADDSFYGVVFASKGSSMLEKIYKEANDAVKSSLEDFETVKKLLLQLHTVGWN